MDSLTRIVLEDSAYPIGALESMKLNMNQAGEMKHKSILAFQTLMEKRVLLNYHDNLKHKLSICGQQRHVP